MNGDQLAIKWQDKQSLDVEHVSSALVAKAKQNAVKEEVLEKSLSSSVFTLLANRSLALQLHAHFEESDRHGQ